MHMADRCHSIDVQAGWTNVAMPLMALRQNGGISTAIISSPKYAAGLNKHGAGKFLEVN